MSTGHVVWSQPVKLFDIRGRRALSTVPISPGMYRIRVLDANDQTVPLRRLNGDDPEGILHTGETGKGSGNLRDRLETFQTAVLGGTALRSGDAVTMPLSR